MESRISGHWRAYLGVENFVVSVGFVRSHTRLMPRSTRAIFASGDLRK